MPIYIFSASAHGGQRSVFSHAWRLCAAALIVAGVLLQATGAAHAEEVFDPPTISNPNLFTSRSSVPDVDQSTGAFVHRTSTSTASRTGASSRTRFPVTHGSRTTSRGRGTPSVRRRRRSCTRRRRRAMCTGGCSKRSATRTKGIGPWYCDRDGFPICGADSVCTCALTCL
jgi:hypothetical protein